MSARDFALQIDREWADKMDDVQEAIAYIGLTALKGVVNKSPVDTGRFKGNWNVSFSAPDATITDKVDPSGGATISEGSATLVTYASFENLPTIHLTNGLPYSERLEDGYSGQAPGGMVGLTVAELEAMFDGTEV